MAREAPGKCPVCGRDNDITRINCVGCDTTIEGRFSFCKFCKLLPEQRSFVEVFIRCRGNIKEVERELGISYPTVKNRLEDAAAALGYGSEHEDEEHRPARKDVLDRLEKGEITVDEAVDFLKEEF